MIYYIHEPLTPNSITRGLFDTEIWYKYYDPNKKYEKIESILNNLFIGRYPLSALLHFKNSLPITDYRNPNGINDNKIDFKELTHTQSLFNKSNILLIKNPNDSLIESLEKIINGLRK